MKVLVTGGAGYIGGAVTDALLEAGHEVRVYDLLLYEEDFRKPVDFYYGDIRDRNKLLPQLQWAEAVVWLAAIVGDGACALNPEITMAINRDSVKWLSDNFDGRIFFMSTCSVYGAQDGILDEAAPTSPLSVYAVSKLEAERFLEKSNALVFRLGTLFGIGDLFSRIRLDLVVNTLTLRAESEGHLTVYGGDQFRPLLHVRDAADAIVTNLTKEQRGTFNLHSKNIRILDLANQIQRHFPSTVIEQTEMAFEDTRNYRASSENAIRQLDFDPTRSVDDGIEEIKALLEEHRLKDIHNVRYTNQGYLSKFNTHM